jgi:hypothetical protein
MDIRRGPTETWGMMKRLAYAWVTIVLALASTACFGFAARFLCRAFLLGWSLAGRLLT